MTKKKNAPSAKAVEELKASWSVGQEVDVLFHPRLIDAENGEVTTTPPRLARGVIIKFGKARVVVRIKDIQPALANEIEYIIRCKPKYLALPIVVDKPQNNDKQVGSPAHKNKAEGKNAKPKAEKQPAKKATEKKPAAKKQPAPKAEKPAAGKAKETKAAAKKSVSKGVQVRKGTSKKGDA